jgi:hypothetical protein
MAGVMAEDRSQRRRRTTTFGLVASGLGVAWVVAYLLLINSQADGTDKGRVAFVASFVGLMAVLSIAGALAAALGRGFSGVLLLAAATGDVGMGFLGLLSIVAPLILAGVLLSVAQPLSGDRPLQNLLPPALVLTLLAFGIALTS